jgi:hypothetical protein
MIDNNTVHEQPCAVGLIRDLRDFSATAPTQLAGGAQ